MHFIFYRPCVTNAHTRKWMLTYFQVYACVWGVQNKGKNKKWLLLCTCESPHKDSCACSQPKHRWTYLVASSHIHFCLSLCAIYVCDFTCEWMFGCTRVCTLVCGIALLPSQIRLFSRLLLSPKTAWQWQWLTTVGCVDPLLCAAPRLRTRTWEVSVRES